MSEQPAGTQLPHSDADTDPTSDVADHPELQGEPPAERTSVPRASGGGAPPDDRPEEAEHAPQTTGTAGGDPLRGVTVDPQDADDARQRAED